MEVVSITCPHCKLTSYNPHDVKYRYCGNCHIFLESRRNMGIVFVFGSNLKGIHGAGAARYALDYYGAAWGEGKGRYGDSYGIPTKDANIQTLPLKRIQAYVEEFLQYAASNPKDFFLVTRIGCGLAGYVDDQIAPFFKDAPNNCFFDPVWKKYNKKTWSDPPLNFTGKL